MNKNKPIIYKDPSGKTYSSSDGLIYRPTDASQYMSTLHRKLYAPEKKILENGKIYSNCCLTGKCIHKKNNKGK